MPELPGFAPWGNTFEVAFLLRDPGRREGVNEMGEVPVPELDDGKKITQSGVMPTMLARQPKW